MFRFLSQIVRGAWMAGLDMNADGTSPDPWCGQLSVSDESRGMIRIESPVGVVRYLIDKDGNFKHHSMWFTLDFPSAN